MCETDKKIYVQRRDKLRQLMAERQLDALLIAAPANRFYLSGFELHDSQCNETSGMLVLTADGRDWLATDSRYTLAAQQLWNPQDIFIYKSPARDLPNLLAACGALIGLESSALSWNFANALLSAKSAFKPAYLMVNGLVEKLRAIKSPEELAALEASFSLNHKMLHYMEEQIASGAIAEMTEAQLAWSIEQFFRENGAAELAFATIVATGPHAALPHAAPGDALIGTDKPLLIDLGCRVDNYCSDQTRTWWLGHKPSQEFETAMKLVKETQQAAIDVIKAGCLCKDVYLAASKVFEKAGVKDHFTHGLGHGVGLETHEAPSLNPSSTQTLETNMVVTVEPGLYYPEWGGIRWENTVVVEENGARAL